jgi:hypothetical protein
MSVQPEHRSILGVDIEGFGRLGRTDPIRVQIRRQLSQLLVGAFLRAGVETQRYHMTDTGDGFLITVGSEVPKSRLLEPFIPWLADRLEAANRRVSRAERIRLRVVLHAGEVLRDPQPNIGQAVILASRLLDAEELRACLAATSAPLVLIVSDWIYQEVVRHRYATVDPSGYRPVRVRAKETNTLAWVYVPADPGAVQRAGVLAVGSRRPPYRGLEAFTEDDAGIFFGREGAITAFVALDGGRAYPATGSTRQPERG